MIEQSPERQGAVPQSILDVMTETFRGSVDAKRISDAMSVLTGEKEAVTPKAPEPEPTKSQKFWREMYQSGDKSPYKVKRGPVKFDALKEVFTDPSSKTFGEHIMAIDKDFRGGVEIGDMKTRATRAAVMIGNMVPNIALDTGSSLIPNLIEKSLKDPLKSELKIKNDLADQERINTRTEGKPLGEVSEATKQDIKKLRANIGYINAGGKLFEVMNDKSVTAFGNTIMRTATGEKGWFTCEASDKLNDLLTYGFGDKIEDVSNGPTVESIFRIAYQVPIFGALIEQVWTRWSNFQSSNEYSKGNLKAVYVAIGLAIGAYRDVDNRPKKSLSWTLTNATYDGFRWLKTQFKKT